MKRLFLALLCALVGMAPAAKAATPSYVSAGIGGYDFDKESGRQSVDYRMEYRWGYSILPHLSHRFSGFDRYVQIHPQVGIEGNTKGALYGNAGLAIDALLWRHGVITYSEALGAFSAGNDSSELGSPLEFRSQLELGWRFDNNLRLTGYISHISNGNLVKDNPGAEIAGVYVHVPLTFLSRK